MPGEVPTAVSEQRRWGASEGEKAQVCGCRAGTGLGSRCGGEALSRSPPFVLRTRPRAPRGHAPRAPCPLQGSGSVQLPTGLASVCGCGAERAAPSAQSVPKGHLRGPVATAASLGSGSWARPEHQRRGGLVPSGGFLCPPDGDSGDLTLGTLPLAHLLGCLWAPPLASRCPGPPPSASHNTGSLLAPPLRSGLGGSSPGSRCGKCVRPPRTWGNTVAPGFLGARLSDPDLTQPRDTQAVIGGR